MKISGTCGKTSVVRASIFVSTLFLYSLSHAAISFSVSPSTISNLYTGLITFQIGGLTNGETVILEKYLDANSNNIIDAPDFLVRSFTLKDGQSSPVIGGATNFNVAGDISSTAGTITAQVSDAGDTIDRFAGNYLLRLASPSSRFAPVTNVFSVTNSGYAQSFTGTVRSMGTNVPYANVVLQYVSNAKTLAHGVTANGSGNYSIKAAPGKYEIFPLCSNYVADLGNAPVLTLASNSTIVTNLNLIPATRFISGRIYDAANPSIGLPGMLIFAQSTDRSQGVLAFTDSNGNYKIPVTANSWQLDLESGAAYLGYVPPERMYVNASTGNVSTANIAISKGTALFYGRVLDQSNNLISNLSVHGSGNGISEFASQGWSDASGNFVLTTLSGDWCVQIDTDEHGLENYVVSDGICTNVFDGQAVLVNFSALLATNHITGVVRDQWTNPVPALGVWAYSFINGIYYETSVDTDSTGAYSLSVANGDWQVSLDCDGDGGLSERGYQCVDPAIAHTPPNAVLNFSPLNFKPYLGSPKKKSNSQFQMTLFGSIPGNYTCEYSTNLITWFPFLFTNAPVNSFVVTDFSATNSRRFYRASFYLTSVYSLNFTEYCNAGTFSGGLTPVVSYPVTLDSYAALFNVQNDSNFPPPSEVYFTGPPGSGLTNDPAPSSYTTSSQAQYQSSLVSGPAAAPGGAWNVYYKSINQAFNIPDPQAAARLVVPLPTFALSSGTVQSVSWVFKNATTGATLAGAPAYITKIQLELEGLFGSVYDSPWLAPTVTNHTIGATINWADVYSVNWIYEDSLGNQYWIAFAN